ncbi:MAG: hypothetical protein HY290_24140 [Planctomycetia bacterium]|nr:hypothetical protein [Planctomycetia bacterium]
MTAFSRLTWGFILTATAALAIAAPPRVTGNRPVRLQVPVPEGDASGRDFSGTAGEKFVASLFPEDPAPEKDVDGGRSAVAELKLAREQLLKVRSISAKVSEKVDVIDKSYKAEGRYLQLGLRENDWKMRLELAVKIGDAFGSLLEVCDGEVLWMRSEIETGRRKDRKETARKDPRETTITRRNVTKILQAVRKLQEKSYETGLIASLGLGGMPALLASIEQNMKLTTVKDATLRDLPMVVIEGTWTDAFAQKLRGAAGPGQPQSTLLPPAAPDSVRIYLARDTGFPHRIMYLKKLPGREVQKPMLTLDFLDVEINQPISSSEFEYSPPKDVTPIELTQGFLDQLAPQGKQPAQGGSQPAGPPLK